MKSKTTINSLLTIFRQAMTPPTAIERIEAHLEAALDITRDTERPEAECMAELRKRLALLPCDI